VGATIIGPNDLALSLGMHSDDQLAALEDPIQHVLDASLAQGIPCGIHIGNLEWLAEWQRRGMQFLCYSNDISFLRSGAATGILWLKESATTAEA
jgi:4-hydroxy-2-oxoheptanedioate aldolase